MKDHIHTLLKPSIVSEIIGSTSRTREIKLQNNLLDIPEEILPLQKSLPYHDPSVLPTNPTILPGRFLGTFAPIFVFRHQIKQIGSYYKPSRWMNQLFGSPEFEVNASYKTVRFLFDYFREAYVRKHALEGGAEGNRRMKWPVLIDGDDLMNDPEGVANRFCEIAGLDKKEVIYEWEKVESNGAVWAAFFETLHGSTGIIKNDVSLLIMFLMKSA
jgi:hypothetical protein